ncbi:hypothetical protein [Oryzomonas rubra]|uniref:General secretion pathway protein B n=1 Tax=Oryzomonas rubra TaxID=2509454 RepID=A0A5A9XH18_9BACT|nr:hypothetical protein [Oryzomonas rubra]KAA0891608.1 hypothetical protein ET418_09145 [Oryzomonas rubra]
MSYILDALKKLESEKERKARGSGMINIAGELFKNGPAPQKERRNWPIVLGLVLLASLITFGATFLLLHGGKGKRHAASPIVMPPPSVTPAPAPPLLPAKPAMPEPPPGPPAAVAPQKAAPPPARVPKAVKKPPVPRHPPVARPARPVAPAAEENAPAEPARPAAAALVAAPADIKVSGIAWQERRGASRAVVNGFLLREGNTVSGARIVEIFQNKVRFSSGTGTFEVYLVATGLPAAPK